MKKINACLVLLFILISNISKSQTPDKWDTLYNQTVFTPVDFFDQCSSIAANGILFLYGDSANVSNSFYQRQSYIAAFNPTTSVLTPLVYTRAVQDKGLNGDASIATSTPGISYAFFGSKLDNSILTTSLTLYKLNTQSNAVTYEQIVYPTPGNRSGVQNLCFFSPATNHDTLMIFDDSVGMKVSIYKKHFNQVGFANTNNLSLPLLEVNQTFVFNNVLYIWGRDLNFNNALLTSANGVTFTVNSNYTAQVNYKVTAVDTLHGDMYFAIDDGDGSHAIWKTHDGVTYTQLTSNSNGRVMSIKCYNNAVWYNTTGTGRPTVMYLSGPSYTTETTSVQNIGREQSNAYTFRLNTLNSELYFAGSYEDSFQAQEYGTFIYKFIPPVANFTITNTQLCFGQPYTATNTSTSADSVRWISDNNFYASTANNYTFGFSSSGSHTIGIIAISGTQKDTMLTTVNVYSISIAITGPATACQITPFQLHSSVANTQGTVTYTWNQTPTFTAAVNGANPFISASNAGPLAYYALATDVNGCQATSNIITVQVYSSKNISGVATTTASPVQGDVVLYKYEPYLTKFDSVTYQTLNAIGEYTFNTIDSGTYLVKCLPTATSLQITYCLSSISWQSAQVLTHGCVNTSTQNINVIPFTNLGAGLGELSGTIKEGQGYGQRTNGISTPGAPIKGVIVKGGRNPGGDISSQSRTNSSGQYTLSGMPVNNPGESYFILVDIPGLDTNSTYHRVITSSNLQFNNLDFIVDSAKVNPVISFVGIQEVKMESSNVRLYPNPTNSNITLEFELNKPAQVKAEMVDMLGRKVKTLLPLSYQNETEVKITSGLKGITPGVYFIKVNVDDTERTTKLIITD